MKRQLKKPPSIMVVAASLIMVVMLFFSLPNGVAAQAPVPGDPGAPTVPGNVTPTVEDNIEGNADTVCSTFGDTFGETWTGFRVAPVGNGEDQEVDDGTVFIDLDVFPVPENQSFNWEQTAGPLIRAVWAKGGKFGGNLYLYNPPDLSSDGLLHTPINNVQGKYAELSHIDFCYDVEQTGSLEVTKTVNWNGVTPDEGQTFEICITGLSYPSGDCKTAGYNGDTLTWNNLIPGSYAVTETDPGTQWTVVVSGSPATVPADGGSASASVTNTYVPLSAITIIKDADKTTHTFDFTGDLGNFNLTAGSSQNFPNLSSGSYTVIETVSGGWKLADVWCHLADAPVIGADFVFDPLNNSATVLLIPDQHVVCTFFNEKEKPTAISLVSFNVEANDGRVMVMWETGAEIDNAGFNLYRAASLEGPWYRVNPAFIAAEGDPVSGASYTFVDRPGRGAFYYRLEDMDYFGSSTLHSPVLVELGAPVRVPWFRPLVPEF